MPEVDEEVEVVVDGIIVDNGGGDLGDVILE